MKANFEVRGKKFKPGFYTIENFNGIMTYWMVYPDSAKFAKRINNSGLILTLFNELPDGATINAHKNQPNP